MAMSELIAVIVPWNKSCESLYRRLGNFEMEIIQYIYKCSGWFSMIHDSSATTCRMFVLVKIDRIMHPILSIYICILNVCCYQTGPGNDKTVSRNTLEHRYIPLN